MQQAGYIDPIFFREEIREHRQQDLPLLMARPTDSAGLANGTCSHLQNRKMSNHPMLVQSVTIESEEQRMDRKRRTKGVKVRKYGKMISIVVGIFVLVDVLDDWFSSSEMVELTPVTIQQDYSRIRSIDDLSTESVDRWCHDDHSKCDCKDPLQSSGRNHLKYWNRTHEMNVAEAETKLGDIDVLFLGDSITEGWRGTSSGRPVARVEGASKVFRKYFSKDVGKYDGLSLGISADTASNLLWRIQNGELPDKLNPKVIWLLIGTNDLGFTWCSPELVLIGILRVIQELRLRKPSATIVVNGLLPRTFNRKGYVMKGRSSLFTWNRATLPSLWADILAVNRELAEYAEVSEKVRYFNTNLFFVDKDAPINQLRIDSKLMPDHLHPSASGYDLWANEIVTVLDELLHPQWSH